MVALACVHVVLDVLCDPSCLLGMATLVPLIESLDSLIIFSKKRDVFICDFIGALKVCMGHYIACIIATYVCFYY